MKGLIIAPLVSRPSLTPPFADPVLIFALAMLVFLAAPLLFERYRLPGIIGIILVGMVIGPNGFALLERDETVVFLGTVGLNYLMFIAGLEIDINEFIENRDKSIVFGLVSFAIPQVFGTIVGVTIIGLHLPAAVLYASVFSSHTLLAYPVIDRLGIVKNEAVTATIGGTILTDTLALLVLTVVAGSVEGELDWLFWAELSIGLVIFFVGVWVTVPRIGRWFFRNLSEESYFEFLFVMAVLFACAFFAELAGIEAIIGAFLAGLALNQLVPQTGPLMNRIEFVGNALFIPFFLLSVGMLVNPSAVVAGLDTALIAGSIVVVLLVTKSIACWTIGHIYGYTGPERLTMFGLTTGQAAAALAITLIGFDLGLFGEPVVNGVVVMILVVSVISPYLSEKYGREIVRAEENAEDGPGEQPSRVLVALSKGSDRMEGLLNLAMLIRTSDSGVSESIRALTVVRDEADRTAAIEPGSRRSLFRRPDERAISESDDGDEEETAAEVAAVEESLEHAEEHAAGADVPIDTLTRIDGNIVTGIVRAIKENRITTIIVGWSDGRSFGDRLFGSNIDQLLKRTTEHVLVSKLEEPLNIMERVVVVLPRQIVSQPGFHEAVRTVKAIADQLGLSLTCLVIGENAERYEQLITAADPETTTDVETVPGGRQLESALRDRTEETDLLIAMSPRQNARGWQPGLKKLPDHLTGLSAKNTIMIYPAEEDGSDDRRFLWMQ